MTVQENGRQVSVKVALTGAADTGKLAKGTLSHFKSAFTDDPSWE